MSRQIVLDTETTGLEVSAGHRIIEIGAVELLDRRLTGNNFHHYIQPDREIDPGAMEVHGITNEFLHDKPRFDEIAEEFLSYLGGADELVIHNAPFDVGFLNNELQQAGRQEQVATLCEVCDSLALARKLYPGKRNSLDALCARLDLDNSHRTLHGALLDSEILADVYLRMTGGQEAMSFEEPEHMAGDGTSAAINKRGAMPVVLPTDTERTEHEAWCARHDMAVW